MNDHVFIIIASLIGYFCVTALVAWMVTFAGLSRWSLSVIRNGWDQIWTVLHVIRTTTKRTSHCSYRFVATLFHTIAVVVCQHRYALIAAIVIAVTPLLF